MQEAQVSPQVSWGQEADTAQQVDKGAEPGLTITHVNHKFNVNTVNAGQWARVQPNVW